LNRARTAFQGSGEGENRVARNYRKAREEREGNQLTESRRVNRQGTDKKPTGHKLIKKDKFAAYFLFYS